MAETAAQPLFDLADDLVKTLPRYVFRSLRAGLFRTGQEFKTAFRDSLRTNFKSGGRKVANAFKVYTSGDDLDSLVMGIFTRWEAAEIYEKGGTIRAKPGRWLIVPVTPRAFTARGRVKRSWRDPRTGKFADKHFQDLRPVKVRGGFLLVRDAGVSKSGRIGKVAKRRGVEATEIVFLLIKVTRRKAVLDFFKTFARLAGPRGEKLQEAVGDALRAFARDTSD